MSFKAYKLDRNNKPVPAASLDEAYEDRELHRVGDDTVAGVRVSTVFLVFDHRFTSEGDPVLWETMAFGEPVDQYLWRYTSYDAAKKGHDKIVELLLMRDFEGIKNYEGDE